MDGHLSLLDQIVLSVFNLDPSRLLFCRADRLQAVNTEQSAARHDSEGRADPRLLSGIEFESGSADGLAGLDCDRNVGLQSLLPWLQERSPDRFVMLKSSRCDPLPGSAVCGDCRCKFVILGGRGEIGDCIQGGPVESVGESLVLGRFWRHGGRGGEVGPLEVSGREVGNSRADGGGEISD